MLKLYYSDDLHRPFQNGSSFGSGELEKPEKDANLLTSSEQPCVASSSPRANEHDRVKEGKKERKRLKKGKKK